MTLFESASLAIAFGQMLTGLAGVVFIWVGIRQMVRASDARAERDGVLLESLSRTNEGLSQATKSLGQITESLAQVTGSLAQATESLSRTNEGLAELLRDRGQARKEEAP